MTRCKICGITNLEDALFAIKWGANALGFVFYEPSPRFIGPVEVSQIIAELPPFVTTVGLFVNPTQVKVEETLSLAQLDLLQFHGNEDETFCNQFDRPYIKALGVDETIDIKRVATQFGSARALLLDTLDSKLRGGTGRTFDWGLITNNLSKPVILAGGLNPANVRKAIQQVRPFGVDVSSGVESHKGKKDPLLIKAFLSEVNSECKT